MIFMVQARFNIGHNNCNCGLQNILKKNTLKNVTSNIFKQVETFDVILLRPRYTETAATKRKNTSESQL